MFENKKRLKQIEEEKENLLKIKDEIEFIKEQLEDKSPKIDISNIYAWNENDIYRIVKICDIPGSYPYKMAVDIFSNEVIYKDGQCYLSRPLYGIRSQERVKIQSDAYAYVTPICKIESALLAYPDKKVPLYVLQRVYYKLNNIDVKLPILKKQ